MLDLLVGRSHPSTPTSTIPLPRHAGPIAAAQHSRPSSPSPRHRIQDSTPFPAIWTPARALPPPNAAGPSNISAPAAQVARPAPATPSPSLPVPILNLPNVTREEARPQTAPSTTAVGDGEPSSPGASGSGTLDVRSVADGKRKREEDDEEGPSGSSSVFKPPRRDSRDAPGELLPPASPSVGVGVASSSRVFLALPRVSNPSPSAGPSSSRTPSAVDVALPPSPSDPSPSAPSLPSNDLPSTSASASTPSSNPSPALVALALPPPPSPPSLNLPLPSTSSTASSANQRRVEEPSVEPNEEIEDGEILE